MPQSIQHTSPPSVGQHITFYGAEAQHTLLSPLDTNNNTPIPNLRLHIVANLADLIIKVSVFMIRS